MFIPSAIRLLLSRLLAALRGFSADNGTQLAASMAYYVALSFFPLLIVLTAGVSSVLEWSVTGQDAKRQMMTVIEQQSSPALREQVERALARVSQGAVSGSWIGSLLLVAAAIAIFTQLQSAFDRIWAVERQRRWNWASWLREQAWAQIKAFGILLAVGTFIVAAIITTLLLSLAETAMAAVASPSWLLERLAAWAASTTLNLIAFVLIYRFIPKTPIGWRAAIQGGVVATCLWEIGRQALTIFLTASHYPTIYGIIGSFIAIMLWAYYGMIMLFFGAEYSKVVDESGRPTHASAALG
jgi:membrane protein